VSLDKPLATVNSVVRKHVLSTHLSDRLARFGTLYSSLLTSLILNDNKQVAEQALLLAGTSLGHPLLLTNSQLLSASFRRGVGDRPERPGFKPP